VPTNAVSVGSGYDTLTAGQLNIAPLVATSVKCFQSLEIANAKDIVLNTSTGTKFGTATSQKLAFFNSTPIVQPANTVGIDTLLGNLGLRATGGNALFALDVELTDAKNVIGTTTTGHKIGTATSQKFSFWNATPIIQPVNTVALDTLLVNTGLRASGGVALFDTDVKVNVVGNGIYVKEGSNATMGRATLVAGTVTVSTTKVTAVSEIFFANNVPGGTVGLVRVSARTAGTSFVLTSSSAADTSTYAWLIMEPA
jgi:hypothetical protein